MGPYTACIALGWDTLLNHILMMEGKHGLHHKFPPIIQESSLSTQGPVHAFSKQKMGNTFFGIM